MLIMKGLRRGQRVRCGAYYWDDNSASEGDGEMLDGNNTPRAGNEMREDTDSR